MRRLRGGDVRGAAAGLARGRGVLRAGPERGRGAAVVLRERAGGAVRAAHRHAARREVSAGWVDKAVARVSARLRAAGFDEAMAAALAAEDVLAADETPVNVLDKAPSPPRRATRARRTRRRRTGRMPPGRRTC